MLISHRKQFIFTKTFKTAGTSIESYFEPWCMHEGEWRVRHQRPQYVSEAGIIGFRGLPVPDDVRWWNHMPAQQIKERIGDAVWDRYFKFCPVRNPFDKMVSAFFYFCFPNYEQEIRRKNIPVSELFKAWLKQTEHKFDRDKYIIDGRFCLDAVIRYEHLHEDLKSICRRLDVAYDPSRLPRFKSEFRRAEYSLADLYTPKSVDIVARMYDYEIERFGYEFPG